MATTSQSARSGAELVEPMESVADPEVAWSLEQAANMSEMRVLTEGSISPLGYDVPPST